MTDTPTPSDSTGRVAAYGDGHEHLLDELRRVDLVLERYVATWRAERPDGPTDVGGLYIPDERIDAILGRSKGSREPVDVDGRQRLQRKSREIRRRKELSRAAGVELRLVTLAERFGLSPRHVETLLLSLVPELDRGYEQVYAYLQDDATRTRPTVDLLLDVLVDCPADRLDARGLFTESSPLRSNDLLRLSPGGGDVPLPSRSVVVDDRIVSYLLGSDEIDPVLAGVATITTPTARVEALPIEEETRRRLAAMEVDADTSPVLYYLHGPDGVGKGRAVAGVCATDSELVRVSLANVPGEAVTDVLARVAREARLRGAALHLEGVDRVRTGEREGEEGDAAVDHVASTLDSFDGHAFLTGSRPWSPDRRFERHDVAVIRLPEQSYALRKEVWESHRDRLPEGLDVDALATTFSLTAGGIAAALSTATAIAPGDDLTEDDVYRGCRARSRDALGDLAERIEPHYDWDDIVLPADTLAHLREVAARVGHRGRVMDDWGFQERYAEGNGTHVLFRGPSGTGKTMAADIVAGDAGLDLYRVDLSTVVSKYIGETETNLRAIFDAAAESDAVLLFDEADALFGKRSEVTDAHDRYANIEVNYLLQRIEAHDGVVILTTNLAEHIDEAFLRRIHASVTFPHPDRDARAAIWERAFPSSTPVGELDVGFLADLEITGGTIKNVATTAAFLAAGDDEPVAMGHAVRALEREFQKTGKLLSPDQFGEYEHLLPE